MKDKEIKVESQGMIADYSNQQYGSLRKISRILLCVIVCVHIATEWICHFLQLWHVFHLRICTIINHNNLRFFVVFVCVYFYFL